LQVIFFSNTCDAGGASITALNTDGSLSQFVAEAFRTPSVQQKSYANNCAAFCVLAVWMRTQSMHRPGVKSSRQNQGLACQVLCATNMIDNNLFQTFKL
jgi:hypothetical protein